MSAFYTFPSGLVVKLSCVQAVWEVHGNLFTIVLQNQNITITLASKDLAIAERGNFIDKWTDAR